MHPIVCAREAKGWTRAQLARQVGVRYDVIGRWERGALPRPEGLHKLAEVLALDYLDLVSELVNWRGEHAVA